MRNSMLPSPDDAFWMAVSDSPNNRLKKRVSELEAALEEIRQLPDGMLLTAHVKEIARRVLSGKEHTEDS